MKNKTIFSIFTVCGLAALSLLSSCSKEDDNTNNNNNNTNPTASTKAFFNLDGKVFVGANSPSFDIRKLDEDTQVVWEGKGGITDTSISISHMAPNFRAGKYIIDSTGFPTASNYVVVEATWGYELSSPFVLVTSGDFEMKRENNKWVAYLTNGKGKNTKNGKRYNSISMKFIYPF
jgi:hypothetical protein